MAFPILLVASVFFSGGGRGGFDFLKVGQMVGFIGVLGAVGYILNLLQVLKKKAPVELDKQWGWSAKGWTVTYYPGFKQQPACVVIRLSSAL